jgi:hypothetical protein
MDKSYESEVVFNHVDISINPVQDDVTAQAQYADSVGRTRGESAEKRLLLAMLTDAVACVRQAKWSRDSSEALEWILESGNECLCSFDTVCELLGLDPTYVRRGVLESIGDKISIPIPFTAMKGMRKYIPIRVAA